MADNFSYCIRALATDVGRKRKANEDFLGEAVTVNGLVTVVCDGMGGHVGGAEASHTAVGAILDILSNNYYDDPRQAIIDAVNTANAAILSRAAAEPSLQGMGSTCVMIIVRDGLVYYGWVGDSRIYLVRGNTIQQLSKDQSVVQSLVDAGIITAAEAEHHARKNEITNCLGIDTMEPAVVCMEPIAPQPGDTFLLCSDGLSGMVNDRAIADVVADRAGMRLQQRAERLIAMANANGGLDNITALLLEFPGGASAAAGHPVAHGGAAPIADGSARDARGGSNRNFITYAVIAGVAVIAIAAGIWLWIGSGDKASTAPKDGAVASTEEESSEPVEIYPVTSLTFRLAETYEGNNTILTFKQDGMVCDVLYPGDVVKNQEPPVVINGTITPDMVKVEGNDNVIVVKPTADNKLGKGTFAISFKEGYTPEMTEHFTLTISGADVTSEDGKETVKSPEIVLVVAVKKALEQAKDNAPNGKS